MKPLSVSFQLMLLVSIVFAVFYPTLFAEVSLIDDMNALSAIFNTDRFSFADVFIPRSSGGGYYRPLIVLSYWFDKWFWFLEGGLMHFESVVAHLCNGILVYFITREVVAPLNDRNYYTPLVASLLFSISPIVTESVNWISGRTDIIMGNFVLISFLLLMKYRRTRKFYLIVLAFLTAFVSLLAKESAFGFLIGMPLVLVCKDAASGRGLSDNKKKISISIVCYVVAFLAALLFDNYWASLAMAILFFVFLIGLESGLPDKTKLRLHNIVPVLAGLLATVALFIAIRRLVFVTDIDKIGQTIKLMFADMNYSISLFLGAVGFYVKKFIIPYPQSFFIIEIDPLYDFLGIAVLFFVVYLMMVRSLPAVIALLGVFMMLPALPFAFGTIAWTAYAERYIYLSSALWWIALCVAITPTLTSVRYLAKQFIFVAIFSIIAVTAGLTYTRNTVWQTNVALLKDTIEHNPSNRMLRDVYMAALIDKGDVEEAKRQYQIAIKLPQGFRNNKYDDRGDLIIAKQYSKEHEHVTALQIYEQALIKTKFGSEALLAGALDEIEALLQTSLSGSERQRLVTLKLNYLHKFKQITVNSHRLLEFGKESLLRGSFQEATQFFDRALLNLPPDHRLRPMISTFLNQADKQ